MSWNKHEIFLLDFKRSISSSKLRGSVCDTSDRNVLKMVKTRNRPESRSKREKVSERVTDIIATTRKWLFPDGVSLKEKGFHCSSIFFPWRTAIKMIVFYPHEWTNPDISKLYPGLCCVETSWKHIRDVAHRLPRERQKHFIHKFSSMERLRSFCTLADNARATSSTLSEDILKSIIQENGEIELSRHLLFILHQRLPSLRHRITELKRENSYHLLDCLLKFPESCEKDLQHEYLRLLITGKCKSKQWKAEVENLMRKASHLHIPNSFKTDIKVVLIQSQLSLNLSRSSSIPAKRTTQSLSPQIRSERWWSRFRSIPKKLRHFRRFLTEKMYIGSYWVPAQHSSGSFLIGERTVLLATYRSLFSIRVLFRVIY